MYAQSGVVQVDWNERFGSTVDIDTGAGNGDVYRRFQDIDGGSNSSASNDTESTTLLDETVRKHERLYDITPPAPHNGGGFCMKIFLGLCFSALIMCTVFMNIISTGNDRGRVGTIAGWGLNTSRATVDYVLPEENTTLIDPLNVCTTEERSGLVEESGKVFLLIVVCSSARNFEARQAIRETWGRVREFNYDQFARLHERMRGEYLEPKEKLVAQELQEYMWRVSDGDDSAPATTTIAGNQDGHAKPNSSSHSDGNGGSSSSSLAGKAFNVKLVFLVGQSEADYVQQRQRSAAYPPADSESDTRRPVSQATDVPVAGGEPSADATGPSHSSLFPSGADVDPAFNPPGNEQVDELQLRLVNESEVYGDIIQESFIDSYNNLTLKTIMMLKWVTNNCDGKVKFIMKCDDDTFVNVPNLLHVLLGGTVPLYKAAISFYDTNTVAVKSPKNRLTVGRHLLTGFLFCEAKPIGDTSSKWYVYSPTYMYDKDVYPNYLSGTAYLMNLETARLLYRASLSTPIFHLEDVYLTGIVADRVKVRRRHHPLFFYSYTKDLCALRGMISQHQLQASELRTAYDYITNGSIVCSGPEKRFTVGQLKLQQRKKCQ
ncbi:AGAP002671-PA [Anopheles gambiae str. PEST]|uniref:AGAP002671-PA n=1 Tax=Anopheles gambiae TaxID=7165 RepID=Q7QCK6_ANOGA|nr:AGAP002671-PA [Anopheles gambiae str. PEST]